MRLQLRKPAQSLTYARQAVTREQLDKFRRALAGLFSRVNEKESEAYQKTIVTDFLREAFGADAFDVSAQEGIDLIIEAKPDVLALTSSSLPDIVVPSIVVETRKVFAGEMMTPLKNNVRALHELILHYFEKAERDGPVTIRHLIITDVYNWFFFDEADFRRFFYTNARLKKLYQIKQQQQKGNPFFFTETARILRELDAEIPVTYLNLRETADSLNRSTEQANRAVVAACKLFSPEHLFKLPVDSGTGTFNQRFYDELLWIVGLRETQSPKVRIERLPPSERTEGSLLENTIQQLQARDVLGSGEDWSAYGADEDEQLLAIGLELCLTWLGRIFLLKVLEGQLRNNYPDGQAGQFLNERSIRNFALLNELFTALTVPVEQRSEDVASRFGEIPSLNGSLFDKTGLEQKTLTVDALTDTLELPFFDQTVLKNATDESAIGSLTTLRYLLTFLEAFDFSVDGFVEVLDERKPCISATMLSLTLERLNDHQNGLLTIPAALTTYTVREGIRRAVLSKFTTLTESISTDVSNLAHATSINELKSCFSYAQPDTLLRLNTVFNSLRIVDPAVGSGRFLVSALNELIALKAELGILVDPNGQRLPQLAIHVVNGDLLITNDDGEPFTYTVTDGDNSAFSPFERQRIQKTIFHEKQTLIQNCLFGVDRTRSSIATYALRLWIELLKSLYRPIPEPQYLTTPEDQFTSQTIGPDAGDLPNREALQLALNSRLGNSLVSRISTDFQIDSLPSISSRETFRADFEQYKADSRSCKQSRYEAEKSHACARVQAFEESLKQLALTGQKELAAIRRLEAKLAQAALPFDFVGKDDRFQKMNEQLTAHKQAFANQQRMFQEAVEWRFLFPEVLDDTGRFVGFDAVIGCPASLPSDEFIRDKSYFQKAFPNTYTSKADPYSLFVELGLRLLKPDGHLAYGLPPKWMQASAAGKLRTWLKTRAIEQIVACSNLSATYEKAVSILIVRNAEATPTFRAIKVETLNDIMADPAFAGQVMQVTTESLQGSSWKFFITDSQ